MASDCPQLIHFLEITKFRQMALILFTADAAAGHRGSGGIVSPCLSHSGMKIIGGWTCFIADH